MGKLRIHEKGLCFTRRCGQYFDTLRYAVEQSIEPIFFVRGGRLYHLPGGPVSIGLSSIQAPRVNKDRGLWRRQPPAMDSWRVTHLFVFVTFASLFHPVLVFSNQEHLKCSSSFLRAGHSYRDVIFSGK